MSAWRDISLSTDVVVKGALHIEHTATGLIPHRLAPWALAQLPSPRGEPSWMQVPGPWAMPAGVRVAFETDADTIELEVLTTSTESPLEGPKAPIFDLVVGRECVDARAAEHGNRVVINAFDEPPRFERGEPDTLRFTGLGSERRLVEIWLPQQAVVELRALRADGEVAPREISAPRWIHHGSSISHCAEAHSPARTWPALVARRRGLDLLDLGFGGNCQLDPFVARTIGDLPAALISLKVGINIVGADTLKQRTFVPILHGFLDTIRERQPTTPLLLASSIICPLVEDRPGPIIITADGGLEVADVPFAAAAQESYLTLRRSRELIADVVAARRGQDPNLHYLDGLRLFGEADAHLLPDGVHPDGDGYELMAERFERDVFEGDGAFSDAALQAAGHVARGPGESESTPSGDPSVTP